MGKICVFNLVKITGHKYTAWKVKEVNKNKKTRERNRASMI